MDHNICMKQTGPRFVIVNHSGNFFFKDFFCFPFFRVFSRLKTQFSGFSSRKTFLQRTYLNALLYKILQNIQSKKVLVCSMVFEGSPLNTLKHFSAKCFIIFFIKVPGKCIDYHFKFFLTIFFKFFFIKVIFYREAFKYLRYKNFSKTRFSDMKKLQKDTKI